MALHCISENALQNTINNAPGKAALVRKPIQRAALGDIGNVGSSAAEAVNKATKKENPGKLLNNKQLAVVNKVLPLNKDIGNSSDSAFSSQALLIEDIDKDDGDNPQLVKEFVNDIFAYLRSLEKAQPIHQNYLKGQQILPRMRGILVDWLVQVHLRFHLLPETLYLTVAIIDRFLQIDGSVSRNKLQLVGVTAMFIASKYEEMYSPEIGDFVYITDRAYTKSEIKNMECYILRTLDFNLGRPLPLHFLRRNSKAGEVNALTHTLAKYLMELTLTEYDMVYYAPSHIAAAALCLSMKVLNNLPWTETLVFYSTYSESELISVMQKMAKIIVRGDKSKFQAVKSKYASSKFMKISCNPELKSSIIKELASS